MASEGYRADLNLALQTIANKLDINPTRVKRAETSYKAVGGWLEAKDSPLLQYSPIIYPQGSFLLGTVVKPLEGDYDLDFVCLMQQGYGLTSQETFRLVGERLKDHVTYSKMLQPPKNRCWRLEYADDFHMDIVPAIPDSDRGNTAILVPDKELTDWTRSDPKRYATWFTQRMKLQYGLQMQALERRLQQDIEDIPDHFKKTELQRAGQLLKRHRDIMFQGEKEKDKPISAIITTLTGHVYEVKGYQEDLFQTLRILAEFMPQRINTSIPKIPNPTNLDEDFADKWEEKPERENAFYEWITQLQTDLIELKECASLVESRDKLQRMFGESVVSESINESFAKHSIKVYGRGRFDVDHRKDPATKWTMAISSRNDVTMRGYIQLSKSQREEFQSNCPPLDKELSIFFLSHTSNIDRPYEVYWQVVNSGEEAAAVEGGLRGGFYESESPGSHKRTEKTQYTGMHWIEAFIVKNGICVARSGEFIVNIK